jgi:hypothetical protein
MKVGVMNCCKKTRTAFAERVSMLKRGRFKCVDSQLSISGLQLHPPPIERQEEWRVGPELRSIKIEKRWTRRYSNPSFSSMIKKTL